MSDKDKLEELRKQLAAMGAVEGVLRKHEGAALKADWDYTSQRKATLKAEIKVLEKKIQDEWQAERDALLAGITTPEQAVQLIEERGNLPLRILLKKSEGGRYQGEVEHSFFLTWEYNRVRVYWSGTAYGFLGECQLDAVKDAESNSKRDPSIIVCDPLSPDCPVEVDILSWVKAFMGGSRAHKFDKRNALFKQKP